MRLFVILIPQWTPRNKYTHPFLGIFINGLINPRIIFIFGLFIAIVSRASSFFNGLLESIAQVVKHSESALVIVAVHLANAIPGTAFSRALKMSKITKITTRIWFDFLTLFYDEQ